jgi:hypothetical protein
MQLHTPAAAYCAPGRKAAAELALFLRGESVTEITEHPMLEGTTDVVLVSDFDLDISPPLIMDEYRVEVTLQRMMYRPVACANLSLLMGGVR